MGITRSDRFFCLARISVYDLDPCLFWDKLPKENYFLKQSMILAKRLIDRRYSPTPAQSHMNCAGIHLLQA